MSHHLWLIGIFIWAIFCWALWRPVYSCKWQHMGGYELERQWETGTNDKEEREKKLSDKEWPTTTPPPTAESSLPEAEAADCHSIWRLPHICSLFFYILLRNHQSEHTYINIKEIKNESIPSGKLNPYSFWLQKENAETCKAAVKDIVDQNRDLEKHTFFSEEHGINCQFKTYLTMIDSGAVNKATGNPNQRCRICRLRMEEYR